MIFTLNLLQHHFKFINCITTVNDEAILHNRIENPLISNILNYVQEKWL